jgi:hypothetical protein
MHLDGIRAESIRVAKALGINIPASLPLLDPGLKTRETAEVAARLLAMNAVAAAAYGFDKASAIAWLQQEGLLDSLSKPERSYLLDGHGVPGPFQAQIEGMWALAWALGLVKELDYSKECDQGFSAMLPNLKRNETSRDLLSRLNLRSLEEVVAACDLAYCLHWAVAQYRLEGRKLPGRVLAPDVIERRRALEWILSDYEWGAVPLDT